MALAKRVTRLMKAYLNHHWERISALIDEADADASARAQAIQELDESLNNPLLSVRKSPSDSAGAPHAVRSNPSESELSRAYRTLGVPEGADLATVRRAYRELSTKANPERFPEGSEERAKAEQIKTHIDRAYQLLLQHLDQSGHRFRHLDLD